MSSSGGMSTLLLFDEGVLVLVVMNIDLSIELRRMS